MELYKPVYDQRGNLLYFSNFPCVKLFCRISASETISDSVQSKKIKTNVDNRMILLPKSIYKLFDIKEPTKDLHFAICVDHFKPHVREGIACGVIIPTEELFIRKQNRQKIKIKPTSLQASFQRILSQLVKGKSLKKDSVQKPLCNESVSKDLSYAEVGFLVNSAIIESGSQSNFHTPQNQLSFSSDELSSRDENVETSSSSGSLINSESHLQCTSQQNELVLVQSLPIEIGDTLSELFNGENVTSLSNLQFDTQANQCLEEFTVDEERLNSLMSVTNFFTQVKSDISNQNILFSVADVNTEINYFGLSDVFKEQFNYHKTFRQLSDLKLALENKVDSSTICDGVNWLKELQTATQFYRLEPLGNFYLTSVKDKVIRKKIISPDYLLEQELILKVSESRKYFLLGSFYFTETIYGCSVFNYSCLIVTLDKIVSRCVFNKGQKNFILFQILSGLSLLHSKGIIHGHLLMENIFVYHNEIKIGNFSNSFLEHLSSTINTPAYSFPHSGPDCFVVPLHLKKSFDIWAFGILAAELHCNARKCPYHEESYSGFNEASERHYFTEDFIKARIDSLPLKTSAMNDVKQLLLNCLQHNPLARSSASDLLLFPIFKYISSQLF